MSKIWYCKIGECPEVEVPEGGDAPMRGAVVRAYCRTTGQEPEFIFSGWGAELTESERAVVEDRLPVYELTEYAREEQREQLRKALEEIADADPVDMALDPGWAVRIAARALLPLPDPLEAS